MIKKIKYIILFSILLILGLCTQSQARIYTSDPTVKSGGTATITISSGDKVASGSIDVTSPGGLSFVSASSSNGVANGTLVAFAGMQNLSGTLATYKFKVPNVSKTTKYKVEFSSSAMKDEDGNDVEKSTATATVTVTASSSSGSSSGSSSSSSKKNSSSNTTTKPTFTTVNETVYATDSVNVRSSYSTSSSVIGSLKAGDEVTRTGKATKAVNGITWSKIKYNGQTAYVSSSYLTTEKPDESNEKGLKTLEITGDYELTPAFSKDVTEYSLTVGADVDSLEINADAIDENAKVEITGNDNLLMGENTIEIKVTAEDGTVRTYKINVTKGEEQASTLLLSELTIDGYTLNPAFSSEIYQYTLNIDDPTITSLNINAKSNMESAVIEIAGNNELKLGENIITILVKSEDGTDVTTYQITVNIIEKQEKQLIAGIDNDDLFLYGGIAVAALIILIIIIIVAVKRRKNKNDDFEPYYGGFDSLNKDSDKEDKSIKDDNLFENTSNIENTNQVNNTSKLDETTKFDINEIPEIKTDKKSVIEENFGADINNDIDEDKPNRKRGKHF